MDKATKVSILLREKEERIAQLEHQLKAKKESINMKAVEHLAQLQQHMEVLKINHEADMSAKNMQLQEMRQAMGRYKGVPAIEEFIKEALEIHSLLVKQQE